MIIKVGFIGMGFMGQVAHLDSFVRVPECEVKAICDIRPKLLRAVAAKYNIGRVYDHYEEMLKDPEIDAVVCCQPPGNTFPLAKNTLLAGKHLLTQIPMATRRQDAQELVKLAQEKKLLYGVSCVKRYDLGVEKARGELARLFETGEFGLLLRVDAHCFGGDWINEIRPPIDFPDEPPPAPPAIAYPDFVAEEMQVAYLDYLRTYSHDINLIRHFLPAGELELLDALISFRQGILSHTTSFRLGNVPVCLRGTTTQAHEWQEEVRFTFEKGSLTVTPPSPLRMQASSLVEIYSSDNHSGSVRTLHSPRLWPYMLQSAGFNGALAGIGEFRSPGSEALTDLILVEEVFKKAKFMGGVPNGNPSS